MTAILAFCSRCGITSNQQGARIHPAALRTIEIVAVKFEIGYNLLLGFHFHNTYLHIVLVMRTIGSLLHNLHFCLFVWIPFHQNEYLFLSSTYCATSLYSLYAGYTTVSVPRRTIENETNSPNVPSLNISPSE